LQGLSKNIQNPAAWSGKKKCIDKHFGEDFDYAEKINLLIKNEYHIKEKLYFYLFNSVLSQTAPTSEVKQFN
jgi:hypothetical protein